MKKIIVVLLVLLLFGAGLSAQNIKIGVIQDLSGPGTVLGTAGLHGAEIAVADINAKGGINGRMLQLVPYDCKSDPNEAINAFRRLADVEKVVAVIGPPLSNIGLAVAPVSTEKKLAFLGMFGDPRCMLGQNLDKLNPYMFLMQPSTEQTAITTGAYMVEKLGYKKIGMLVAQDHAYVLSMANYFKEYAKKNGIEIVADEVNKQADIDMKAQLLKIKKAGAEAIFNSNPTQPLVASTSQAYQLGINLPATGSLDYAAPFASLLSDPRMANNIYFVNNVDEEDPALQGIRAAYKAKFKAEPTNKSYLGYDEILILVEAIKQAGSTDRDAIRNALENKINDLPINTGVFTMDPKTHMPIGLTMVIYKIENGKYVSQGRFVPEALKKK
ncbi:MAG: ABC transporter substrate-binding protein [Spirochaetales bacterium]|jgi:branched-chain amino acid transport system substrate-binding protein